MAHPRFHPGRRSLAAGAGGTGTIADYGALAAWYDASDSSSITLSSSDVVTWNDKSGQGNHVTEATNRPSIATAQQNGLDGIYFDGTESLSKASPVNMQGSTTVFFVAENEEGGAPEARCLCGIGGLTSNLSWQIVKSAYLQFISYTSTNGVGFHETVSSTNIWRIADGAIYGYVYHDATDMDLFWDGGTAAGTANVKNVSADDFIIGGGDPYWSDYVGYVYEIAVYSEILSAANQASVVASLTEKWGL